MNAAGQVTRSFYPAGPSTRCLDQFVAQLTRE